MDPEGPAPADVVAPDPAGDLTLRALAQGMSGAGPPAPPGAAPGDTLLRMQESADLFGFAITARRRLVGLPLVKRALRRLQYQVFARQSDFNAATTQLVSRLAAAARDSETERRVAVRTLAVTEDRLRDLERRLRDAVQETSRLHAELTAQRLAPAASGDPGIAGLDYVGLQARFRGNREEIAERQRGYLEHFAEGAVVLDVGCGRGEFLELLRDSGRRGIGVDANAEMVALCRADGLEVIHDDGLRHLAAADDESLDGVFAAQVIEHLAPAQVIALLQEARRVLRPGGVLVLETVNPTSLVALMNFYVDPTHVAPVHPLALEWMAQSSGYVDVRTLYLSPAPDGPRLRPFPATTVDEDSRTRFDDGVAATNDVLYGPRDYALIARKR